MPTVDNAVVIARPVEAVYAFLADLENLPRWNYAIERTVQASPGPVGVGTVYRQLRSLPTRSEEHFEVTAFEPPRLLEIDGPIGPFHTTSSYLLTRAGAATRLVNTMRLEPLPGALSRLALLAVPQIRSAVAGNLGRLTAILEGAGRDSARLPGRGNEREDAVLDRRGERDRG